MTRRTPWPEQEDSGGFAPPRAGTGPPRSARGAPARGDGEPEKAGGARENGENRNVCENREDRERGRGEQQEPQDPLERARAICLRLLTGTPRTRRQLAEALSRREIPDEAAEEVLSRFEEVGLIDDAAYADAWVESRHHSRGLARKALGSELRAKGVDSATIDIALEQVDSGQEADRARALVDRRLGTTAGLERGKRIRRLVSMLARKGYSEGLSLRVVRQALEEEGEDAELLERHLPED